MSNESTSPRGKHANRTALPSRVDPLSITVRDLRASMPAPHSDARLHREPSQEETEDTTPFELVDPVNASATLRDIPVTNCRKRVQIALVASFVIALAGLAGYITTAV